MTFFLLAGCAKDNESKSYIVVFKRNQVDKSAVNAELAVTGLSSALSVFHEIPVADKIFSVALQGGVFKVTKAEAERLANDPRVAYVEEDKVIRISTSQNSATWGIDRLDQSSLPLNQTYNYENSGNGVNVYVIDTGILTTHQEFGSRAVHGIDTIDWDNDATDCNGHGTHVSGTIGGTKYGVAKNVKLHGVRVLDCGGSGSISSVVAGIEWVTANHVKPAVANMSLGGGASQALDDAVLASIHAGVTYVVAAGNEDSPACNVSPARVAQTIAVGSVTKTDARSSFSNFGSCVSLFAPGSDIESAGTSSTTASDILSGTSMASPHAAGVAALYLAFHPQAQPSVVKAALVQGAIAGKVSDAQAGSPNRLLNTLFLTDSDGGNEEEEPQTEVQLQNGVALSALSAAAGEEKYFAVQIPAGHASFVVEISGGSGDADLYVKKGARPTTSNYDCRPYLSGNGEACNFASPVAGTWYILIKAYSPYTNLSVRALYQKLAVAPCENCLKSSGALSTRGSFRYHTDENGYAAALGVHEIWLTGPESADFDLYLYKKSGSDWIQVASSTQSKSIEKINYDGIAGTYRIKVISYSGSGNYEVWNKAPH